RLIAERLLEGQGFFERMSLGQRFPPRRNRLRVAAEAALHSTGLRVELHIRGATGARKPFYFAGWGRIRHGSLNARGDFAGRGRATPNLDKPDRGRTMTVSGPAKRHRSYANDCERQKSGAENAAHPAVVVILGDSQQGGSKHGLAGRFGQDLRSR